ncbi:GC-rich sequence DNA-binding factor, partial [Perkinsus olseni]
YQLLFWDPFNLSGTECDDDRGDDEDESHRPRIVTTVEEVMDMEWFISLTDYCNPPGPVSRDQSDANASTTADSLVVPHVVHECLFDRVRHFIANVWNVSSMKHGKIVKELLQLCIDFDEISDSGSSPYKDVILTACEGRVKRAVEGLLLP